MDKKINDLLLHCRQARSVGRDFPSIWADILKGNPLILGSPVQGHDGETTTLSVRLSGDATLVFDGSEFFIR